MRTVGRQIVCLPPAAGSCNSWWWCCWCHGPWVCFSVFYELFVSSCIAIARRSPLGVSCCCCCSCCCRRCCCCHGWWYCATEVARAMPADLAPTCWHLRLCLAHRLQLLFVLVFARLAFSLSDGQGVAKVLKSLRFDIGQQRSEELVERLFSGRRLIRR